MALQSRSIRSDESLLWLNIVENILMVADVSRLESATGGQWRATIARCLKLLIQEPGKFSFTFISNRTGI